MASAAEKETASIEKNEAADKARSEAASASSVAADVEAKATAELREQHRAELIEELRLEAVGKAGEKFGGQVVSTDNFVGVTTDSFGRELLEIKPNGWVGEGFVISAKRVKELAKLVGQVKNLPEQD